MTVTCCNINAYTQIRYVTNIYLQISTNVTVVRVRMELRVTTKLMPTTALVWKATTAPIAKLVCSSITIIIFYVISMSITCFEAVIGLRNDGAKIKKHLFENIYNCMLFMQSSRAAE